MLRSITLGLAFMLIFNLAAIPTAAAKVDLQAILRRLEAEEREQNKFPPYKLPNIASGISILGQPELTAADLDKYVRRVNPSAPAVAKYYIEYGKQLGIRGDIAFAQAILETGYFRYSNPKQNNFAGIGAVGGGAKGHSFKTPAEGVRAQLEHLWAYATSLPLATKPVDPRFHFVQRGSAPTWEALGGKWAVPGYSAPYKNFDAAFAAGETYGQRILRIYMEMMPR